MDFKCIQIFLTVIFRKRIAGLRAFKYKQLLNYTKYFFRKLYTV